MIPITDFHSHVLPGIDDGSGSLAESIALLQMESSQGISRVVATPHFYAHCDNLDQFLKRRSRSEHQLRQEMSKYSDLPEVVVGAEVSFFSGMGSSTAIKKLVIGSTKYILIEMPPPPWTDSIYSELQKIYDKQGLVPIIAHIDRYISRYRTFGIPRRLAELPVIVQGNADAFLDKRTVSMALRMLRKGQIHVLGSDCHNTSSRLPELGDALQVVRSRLGEKTVEVLITYGEGLFRESS